jgi:beta-galactosidase
VSRFAIGDEHFELDGEPFRVLSGAIHYFRVHPDHWADRIHKARLMGLNTIETYVAWNLHSPEPGDWDTTGRLDLGRFLDAVAAEDMYAIVRPGPYICAELDNGGLPTWLFADPSVGVRRREPQFLDAIGGYLDRVLEIVAPRQLDAGGPVILVQVENEYGAYGDDTAYLQLIADRIRAAGIRVPLTTVDQPQPHMLAGGSLPGVHLTASFGSRSVERMATLRAHQPTGPLMSSEYWDGWFDSWGDFHHTTSAAESAADLDALLSLGASVNLYMFHGGTNFGLTNGANDRGVFKPIVTSYDYDAPLDEAGRTTEKYRAYREVIAKYAAVPDEVPAASAPAPVDEVPFTTRWSSLDAARATVAVETDDVPTFAAVKHSAAFLVHTRAGSAPAGALTLGEVRDRVHVIADGLTVGILSREFGERMLTLPAVERELTLVVESQGRVNYGRKIGEDKGIVGGAALGGAPLRGWSTVALSPTDLTTLATAAIRGDAAVAGSLAGGNFARAEFEVAEPEDRFLSTVGWGKGVAWINGFCLGRYWSRPPQRTLYVPGPVLRPGPNELVILELDGAPDPVARFVADADLGPLDD